MIVKTVGAVGEGRGEGGVHTLGGGGGERREGGTEFVLVCLLQIDKARAKEKTNI